MLRVGWLTLLLMCLLPGCEREQTGLVSVTGILLLNNEPLSSGSVTLEPDSSENSWDRPVGMVGLDGRFEVYTNGRRGVLPGSYRAIVFATRPNSTDGESPHPGLPQSLVPVRYQRGETTPLRILVESEPVFVTLTIDLE